MSKIFAILLVFVLCNVSFSTRADVFQDTLDGKSFTGVLPFTVWNQFGGSRDILWNISINFFQFHSPHRAFVYYTLPNGKRYSWRGTVKIKNNNLTITSAKKRWVFTFEIRRANKKTDLLHILTKRTCDWIPKGDYRYCKELDSKSNTILAEDNPQMGPVISSTSLFKSANFEGTWEWSNHKGKLYTGHISIIFSQDGEKAHFTHVRTGARPPLKWTVATQILQNDILAFDRTTRKDVFKMVRLLDGRIMLRGVYIVKLENRRPFGGVMKLTSK